MTFPSEQDFAHYFFVSEVIRPYVNEFDLAAFKTAYVRIMTKMEWPSTKTFQWMSVANGMLGGLVPLEMIYQGRIHKLLNFINTSLDQNHPV